MKSSYIVAAIIMMMLATMLVRFLPFIIFERGGKVPAIIEYLGKVLPPALMSFLIIYCIRSIDLTTGDHGLPELIGVATAMGLHFWKRNTFISIGVATLLYMFLVQVIF